MRTEKKGEGGGGFVFFGDRGIEGGGRSLCGGEGSEALFGQGWWRGMKGGGGGYVPQRGEREREQLSSEVEGFRLSPFLTEEPDLRRCICGEGGSRKELNFLSNHHRIGLSIPSSPMRFPYISFSFWR